MTEDQFPGENVCQDSCYRSGGVYLLLHAMIMATDRKKQIRAPRQGLAIVNSKLVPAVDQLKNMGPIPQTRVYSKGLAGRIDPDDAYLAEVLMILSEPESKG